jgi:NAD(P)-dependent dehydrogenase (short-subunit alcohol dehydrogenase family)
MGILDKFNLKGKKAYVTGASKGIGKATAIALCEAGADVAFISRNMAEAAAVAKEAASKTGVKTIAIEADVSKPEDVDAMFDKIMAEFGTIDIAFNNAGVCPTVGPAEDMKYEDIKEIVDINLIGTYLCSQRAGRIMLEKGSGSIINMASMSAHISNVPQKASHYAATKAGVIAMSRNFAAEWSAKGVRVNSISPGYHMTEMAKQWTDMHPIWLERIPANRFGDVDEIAGLVVFLAGDAANYINGTDIIIDGGYTAW